MTRNLIGHFNFFCLIAIVNKIYKITILVYSTLIEYNIYCTYIHNVTIYAILRGE